MVFTKNHGICFTSKHDGKQTHLSFIKHLIICKKKSSQTPTLKIEAKNNMHNQGRCQAAMDRYFAIVMPHQHGISQYLLE